EELLADLGRIVRRWSTVPAPWPASLDELGDWLPPGACIVAATSGSPGVTLAVAPGREPAVGQTTDRIAEEGPCDEAEIVFWLGPAAAPGGLYGPDSERLLVRLTGPDIGRELEISPGGGPGTSRDAAAARAAAAGGAGVIGPGPQRNFRRLVEELAGAPSPRAGRGRSGAPVVHLGAGLALARSPWSSGWLVAPAADDPHGWIGPAALERYAGGGGLLAAGVRSVGEEGGLEIGSWVLAEAALAAGHSWVLLSRRPLHDDELETLFDSLDLWDDDPVSAARLLRAQDAGLADAIAFWTTPQRWPPRARQERLSRPWMIALGLLAAGALAACTLVWRRRRALSSKSRSREALRAVGPPD
ncbi:MAG: hypothetical protein JSV80_09905, partial [Acidobacteriota bacterium]